MPRFYIRDSSRPGLKTEVGTFHQNPRTSGSQVLNEAQAVAAGRLRRGINAVINFLLAEESKFIQQDAATGTDIVVGATIFRSVLVGSTTPKMTSNTLPGTGTASASSVFDTGYAAWKAFTGSNLDSSDAWLTSTIPYLATPASWQWLKYLFNVATVVTSFSITSRNYNDATHPKTWIFQGSIDGFAWDDLVSVTGDTAWVPNQTKTYSIPVPGAYRHYRILIKECTGVGYLAIGELSMLGTLASRTATPLMTSNTAPSGVASASSVFDTGYAAWKAFDQTNADYLSWYTDNIPAFATPGTWQWLKYDFGAGNTRSVTSYTIVTRNYSGITHPQSWVVQGSNDNTAWTDLHDVANKTWAGTAAESATFTMSTVGAFRYYRVLIRACKAGATACAIGELTLTESTGYVMGTRYITTSDLNHFVLPTAGTVSNVSSVASTPANTAITVLASFDNRATWKKWNGSAWVTSSLAAIASGNTLTEMQTALLALPLTGGTLDLAWGLTTSDSAVTPTLTSFTLTTNP